MTLLHREQDRLVLGCSVDSVLSRLFLGGAAPPFGANIPLSVFQRLLHPPIRVMAYKLES